MHLVGVYDDIAGIVKLYLDGKEIISTNGATTPTNYEEEFKIGRRSKSGEAFTGSIDDV